jgi:superfamily II DNA helicase RecQ
MAILDQERDVLVITKTGSGKSMLYLVPSQLEHLRTTAVILPLVSLMDDFERKLVRDAVKYEAFRRREDQLNGLIGLILTSADMAKTQEWRQQMAIVDAKRPVTRFVWDEGQLPLTSADFRFALRDLHEVRLFPHSQLVVGSGTIPSESEADVLRLFCMGDDAVVIREHSTSRPEIKYVLERPSSRCDILKRVQELVEELRPTLGEHGRGLVFVPYIDLGSALAELLDCPFYRGDGQVTREERSKLHQRFVGGQSPVMVCTSAFGVGNDYPHVRFSIHADSPKEYLSFVQETGRIGRDGEPTIAYILPNENSRMLPLDGKDHGGIRRMYQLLHTPNSACIRFDITEFCDGHGTGCSDSPTSQACSRCPSAVSRGKQKAVEPPVSVVDQPARRMDEPMTQPAQPVVKAWAPAGGEALSCGGSSSHARAYAAAAKLTRASLQPTNCT